MPGDRKTDGLINSDGVREQNRSSRFSVSWEEGGFAFVLDVPVFHVVHDEREIFVDVDR